MRATIILLALMLAACGVKSPLMQPGASKTQTTPKEDGGDRDPSAPPQPLGR